MTRSSAIFAVLSSVFTVSAFGQPAIQPLPPQCVGLVNHEIARIGLPALSELSPQVMSIRPFETTVSPQLAEWKAEVARLKAQIAIQSERATALKKSNGADITRGERDKEIVDRDGGATEEDTGLVGRLKARYSEIETADKLIELMKQDPSQKGTPDLMAATVKEKAIAQKSAATILALKIPDVVTWARAYDAIQKNSAYNEFNKLSWGFHGGASRIKDLAAMIKDEEQRMKPGGRVTTSTVRLTAESSVAAMKRVDELTAIIKPLQQARSERIQAAYDRVEHFPQRPDSSMLRWVWDAKRASLDKALEAAKNSATQAEVDAWTERQKLEYDLQYVDLSRTADGLVGITYMNKEKENNFSIDAKCRIVEVRRSSRGLNSWSTLTPGDCAGSTEKVCTDYTTFWAR